MTIGPAPDWQDVTWMVGNYGGTPTLIAVDDQGRMYAILVGAVTIADPVDVTQISSIREIQGADGVTLRTIAVDDQGRIIALIKGVHDSTLTNVAVDATGRMIMIPTDPADVWGNAISMGNAELAAVFGFAKQYDRRGQVIYVEGFENGLVGWEEYISGTGAAVRHSTKQAKSGSYSCELVGGLTVERYGRIKRSFGVPVVGNMGYEFSFTLDPDTGTVSAWLWYYDGTNRHQFVVTYDKANTRLGCGGADGLHTILNNDLDLYTRDTQFHTIKVVIDLENLLFVRVLCDGLSYTPTTEPPATSANTEALRLELNIQNAAIVSPALNPNIWIDNIILTQMEPD